MFKPNWHLESFVTARRDLAERRTAGLTSSEAYQRETERAEALGEMAVEILTAARVRSEKHSIDNMDALHEQADLLNDAIDEAVGARVESREVRIESLANVFHEVWLRTRNKRSETGAIYANGVREPRMKPTTDQDWVDAVGGGDATVDIVNTGFVRLPKDWQAENVAAAIVIIDLIEEFGGAKNVDLSDPEVYDKCGDRIHERWLERNTYAKGGDLDVSFKELPEEQQTKDLEQLRIALEIFKPQEEGAPFRPFATRALRAVNNWALERRLPIRAANGDLIEQGDPYYQAQLDALMDGRR